MNSVVTPLHVIADGLLAAADIALFLRLMEVRSNESLIAHVGTGYVLIRTNSDK